MRPKIKISDYSYILPEERIAKYPLECRDASKLLLYKDGMVKEERFTSLPSLLPKGSLMVFNETKVVPARLFFRKSTGAKIEIFCLEPVEPKDYQLAFASTRTCKWNVVIGNAKRWREGEIEFFCDQSHTEAKKLNLRASIVTKEENNGSVVSFTWDGGAAFSEVLEICGRIPIPPYLKRDTETLDIERYQTLYARIKGSVAAPTAGLHFTDRVLQEIDKSGITRDTVCLHVGAGTFVPVKSEYIEGHKMHTEPFTVTKGFIANYLNRPKDGKLIAVGTTSMRTLESLYYIGVHIIRNGQPGAVEQWEPYDADCDISSEEAMRAIYNYLEDRNMDAITARTAIIIAPSYKFRIVDILVTNFHQPQSTLLLLISAFVGDDWREIYRFAMDNGFRFLSYGDSSLLYRRDGVK